MLLPSDQKRENEEIDVCKEVEITVRVKNEPGVLASLFTTVASCGTEILACSSYSNGEWAVVLLVTRNPAKTKRALNKNGFDYGIESVVLVNAVERLGSAVQLTAQLRTAGIGMIYSYTWWSESLNGRAVFKTQDDDRALQVLRDYLAVALPTGAEEASPRRLNDRQNGAAGQRRGHRRFEHTQRH